MKEIYSRNLRKRIKPVRDEEAFIEEYSEKRLKEFAKEDKINPSIASKVKKPLTLSFKGKF